MATGITEGELLDALHSALRPGATEAKTVEDLVIATGLSKNKVRIALGQYQRQGRLTVHQVLRPAIDGRQCYRPGYTILPAKKKK